MLVTRRFRQALLLGIWSFICVLPLLLKQGPNVVTQTYFEGSERFYQGLNPYQPSAIGADFFFYPPFFALFWKIFSVFGKVPGILIWAFVNSLVFWWGISQWVEIRKKQTGWIWFFLVCSAIELDISLRYQQANALLAGLILWALAELRDQKPVRSGLLLAFATQLKVFPIVVALILALNRDWNFLAAYSSGMGLLFLMTTWFFGFSGSLELHWQQFQATTHDFSQRQLLDLAACLRRIGYAGLGSFLQELIGVVGGIFLVLYRLLTPNNNYKWGLWYSSCVTWLLIITPKAESPTFVWAAPAYLLLQESTSRKSRWLLVGIALMLTLVYSSLFPSTWVSFFRWEYTSKTLANLTLWLFASWLLFRDKVQSRT